MSVLACASQVGVSLQMSIWCHSVNNPLMRKWKINTTDSGLMDSLNTFDIHDATLPEFDWGFILTDLSDKDEWRQLFGVWVEAHFNPHPSLCCCIRCVQVYSCSKVTRIISLQGAMCWSQEMTNKNLPCAALIICCWWIQVMTSL